MPREVEKLQDDGVEGYLTKPLDIPRFLETVDEHLGKGARDRRGPGQGRSRHDTGRADSAVAPHDRGRPGGERAPPGTDAPVRRVHKRGEHLGPRGGGGPLQRVPARPPPPGPAHAQAGRVRRSWRNSRPASGTTTSPSSCSRPTAPARRASRPWRRGPRTFSPSRWTRVEVMNRIRNLLEVRLLYEDLKNQNVILEEKVRERTQELKETRLEVIHRLGRAAEFRDEGTGLHLMRISQFAVCLSRAAGLPGRDDGPDLQREPHARHREDRHPRPHPLQEGQAGRRGVGHHEDPHHHRGRPPLGPRLPPHEDAPPRSPSPTTSGGTGAGIRTA